ncbi:phytochrome-like protein cph1 [Mariprofundus micogutta]|uniref:histidine kinase n=1 Tax=Mariprofundus micogutta TaxID=1921010 RepID=A0A1L8CP66_9PROT|nr:sensor histidine kinase [Mariprofundus micogutta]GAV20684.1 phytochrome-like protein cph1 [Mariprofundus micogutta]
MHLLNRFSDLPVRYRIIFTLIVVVLISEVSLSFFAFKQFENSMIAESIQHLRDIRSNRIYSVRTELTQHIQINDIFSSLPETAEVLVAYNKLPGNRQTPDKSGEAIEHLIHHLGEQTGLYDLFVIAKNGDIIHSAKKEADFNTNLLTGPYRNTALAKAYRHAINQLQTRTSSIAFYMPSNAMAVFIASPVILHGQLLGAVAIQLDWKSLADILGSITGLGKSGEVVAGVLHGDKAYLAPLRHMPTSEMDFTVPMGANLAGPIQDALQGHVSSAFDVDYRNIPVVAAWGYIPELEMGLVVKMDKAELMESVQNMQQNAIMIVLGVMIGTVFIGMMLARTISSPIDELTETTLAYADGNMEERSNISSHDEIGLLATAFNTMADNIKRYNQDVIDKNLKLKAYGEELEQRVEERTATLSAANEEIKSFAYIVSHDLRSPLVNLKGFTGELDYTLKEISEKLASIKDKLEASEQQEMQKLIEEEIPESMGFITTSVEKMDAMLAAILKLSRLGRRELVLETIDLSETAESLVDIHRHQLQETHSRVDIGDLPCIRNDRMVVEQILGNLIDNAIKYLDPERAGEISISAVSRDSGIAIAVTDNGHGIAESENDKVFQIFRRGRHTTVQGEGMGLAYVQTLARAQGGSITFESQENLGTTFTVFLPCIENNEV